VPRRSPDHQPPNALAAAIRTARGTERLTDVAPRLKIAHVTLSRLERGTHRPSADTARSLARWLGWTVEQVLDAAEKPAPGVVDRNTTS
jgi:transcriptional regulator with XRE-family HTH domain